MKSDLTLAAISLDQPGGTFFYCAAKVADIKDRLQVRRRSQELDAVQRDLNGPRASEIARYLEGAGSILPTPLVISADHVSSSEAGGITFITLSPDANGFLGELIDGQHRLAGLLRTKQFDDSDIGLCIFASLSIEDKAELFGTINSTQVRVPKSYIYDLFGYTDNNTPIKFAHTVCKITNESPHSPLHRRIKMLGKKLHAEEVLSQAAFVDGLIGVFSDDPSRDRKMAESGEALPNNEPDLALRALYIENNSGDMAKIVSNHLVAVKSLVGPAWEAYYLKSIGIKVALGLLKVVAPTAMQRRSFTTETLTGLIAPISKELSEMSTKTGTNDAAMSNAIRTLSAAFRANTK